MSEHFRPIKWMHTPSDADPTAATIMVELTRDLNGVEAYAIRYYGVCLSRQREWHHEPRPSSRTDEWLKDHRWPSLALAMDAAHAAWNELSRIT